MLTETDSQCERERGAASQLGQALRERGYKLTAARLAVVRAIESDGRHLSPAEVWQRGRAIYPRLSRATVYRTLELLTDMGVLRPIYLGERASRLARIEGGHQHMVCLDCGGVTHLDERLSHDLEAALARRLAQDGSCRYRSYLLELYGVCADCSHAAHDAAAPSVGGDVRCCGD